LPPSWLATFGDSTLTALVLDGLRRNFDLQAAAARVDAAENKRRLPGPAVDRNSFFSRVISVAKIPTAADMLLPACTALYSASIGNWTFGVGSKPAGKRHLKMPTRWRRITGPPVYL